MTTSLRVADMSAEAYYAPQMIAEDLGFLADEGLTLETQVLDTSRVPQAIAADRADFALCGMWQPWLYTERMDLPFTVFAQLNQQVPLLVFGRTPRESFDWGALGRGTLLHTLTVACSPWCALQGLLGAKGVDRGTMRMVDGFPPDEALELFRRGMGDAVEVFAGRGAGPWLADPEAHLIVDWQADVGRIPWSVYFTTPDRLERLRPQLVAFTRALGRAQAWLREHDADAVADAIAPRFADADEAELRATVAHFVRTEQWPAGPAMERESVERWRAILGRVGILSPGLPYDAFVDESVAADATAAATGAGA